MSRKVFVAANWKMNPDTLTEARKLFASAKKAAGSFRGELVLCPPSAYLSELSRGYRGSRIVFGAQDVSHERAGAHTGEISGAMLRSVGASYALAGHSERRAQGEGNESVGKKVSAALSSGLSPILCVGERIRDEHGDFFHVVEEQLRQGLAGVAESSLPRITVAYEPVWAIGKRAENAMKPADAHEMAIFIRKTLTQSYDRSAAGKVRILYGGSVEPENVAGLLADGGVGGFLVGHVSIEPARFAELLKIISAF